MIELKRLRKSFGEKEVLHGIDLEIADGDVFGIIGVSGAGKSTLVRCINLLERPTSGQVLIDGVDVTDFKGAKLIKLRESIGMIFQNFSLFQQRSVAENVAFPLALRRVPKAERQARSAELLRMVDLEALADAYPVQLSGGQQQRVAIARALANRPRIMLCDEATSALDTRTTMSILELLARVNRDLGVTMVVITHSLAVAQRICNRIAVIDDGRIVEQGTTREVFSHPKAQMTKDLLLFDTVIQDFSDDERRAAAGDAPLGMGEGAESDGRPGDGPSPISKDPQGVDAPGDVDAPEGVAIHGVAGDARAADGDAGESAELPNETPKISEVASASKCSNVSEAANASESERAVV